MKKAIEGIVFAILLVGTIGLGIALGIATYANGNDLFGSILIGVMLTVFLMFMAALVISMIK